jgi:DNA-binding winged helix-turn-helix (wHTH) protein/tetratricopeptide (TPR) repeat protein
MDYRFGRWRIEPSTRELWNDDTLQPVARRVFDCLAYLIEHRERAVGRDELVAALWGRVDVADVLVSQLIARARKTIGDDAQVQAAIRTVAGFGYRWVMPLQAIDGASDTIHARPSAAEVVSSPDAPPAPVAAVARHRWLAALMLAVVIVAATGIGIQRWHLQTVDPPAARESGEAVVVLPFDIDASRDAGWVRLGAMDLVAERLRGAGLAVPSSDSVLVALHALPPGGSTDNAALGSMFHARVMVHGHAVQAADGWRVELDATDVDGTRHKVAAVRPVVTDAARQAGDLLLAALGHAGPAAGSENDALDERLQRAQSAILANEFDTARTLLDQATLDERKDARLRYRLAQIDFHSGRLSEADGTLHELLADPSALAPSLHGDTLVASGMLAMRRGDCAIAETRYNDGLVVYGTASTALDQGKALAGRGLARACLHHYEEAANDLGLARARMASAGDRLGLARVENYRGLLDVYRNRLTDALGDFQRAADTYAAFGATDALRAALSGLLDVQVNLLHHHFYFVITIGQLSQDIQGQIDLRIGF